jgi:hypothetical protein
MERNDTGLKVCGVKIDAIKNGIFTPDSSGCLDLSFDRVLDFVGNIAITGRVGSGS